jgi:hypothetical protein
MYAMPRNRESDGRNRTQHWCTSPKRSTSCYEDGCDWTRSSPSWWWCRSSQKPRLQPLNIDLHVEVLQAYSHTRISQIFDISTWRDALSTTRQHSVHQDLCKAFQTTCRIVTGMQLASCHSSNFDNTMTTSACYLSSKLWNLRIYDRWILSRLRHSWQHSTSAIVIRGVRTREVPLLEMQATLDDPMAGSSLARSHGCVDPSPPPTRKFHHWPSKTPFVVLSLNSYVDPQNTYRSSTMPSAS